MFWVLVVTVSIACFALSFVSQPVERSITDLKMLIRGSQPPDSSLFILYLDNFDISNLGGYPVSRLHIASAVHALSMLDVSVVGIDLLFEKQNLAYPEYDLLLAEQMTRAGNVILGMYFQQTSRTGSGVPTGTEPIYPHRLFRESAAGVGSSNFFLAGVTRSMPLFFQTQTEGDVRLMPVLALRMLWQNKCKEAVAETDSAGTLDPAIAAAWLETCLGTSSDQPVRLNFRGTQRSYIMIPFVSFMKSYDSLAQGYEVQFPFRAMRNKAALIGVAAEGRSPFVSTPFSRAFPALALHAVLFDTLLHGSQIRDTPWWIVAAILFLAALGGAYIKPFARLKNFLVAVAVFAVYLAAVEGAFILYFWDLPVIMPLLGFGLTALGTVLMRSRERSSYIASLEQERKELHQELKRRTLELENTRREILQSSEEIPPSVEARIQEYEREIARLRMRINDVVLAE
ncbi:MAG: CHASE2 domain-containing protein, partial [Chlorobi bacterium]|nr:CHASE2 domain-containing protein [Chlorobiota bacterium]